MKKYSTLEVFEMMHKNMELEFEVLGVKCYENYPNTIKFNKEQNTICWGGDKQQPIKVSECFLNLGWKKANKSVTFQEVLKSNKKIRVDKINFNADEQLRSSIPIINEIMEQYKKDKYIIFSDIIVLLAWYLDNNQLIEVIENGKWYLQEEEDKDCQASKKEKSGSLYI